MGPVSDVPAVNDTFAPTTSAVSSSIEPWIAPAEVRVAVAVPASTSSPSLPSPNARAPPVSSVITASLVVTPLVPSTVPMVRSSASPKVNALSASATFAANVSTSLPDDRSTASSTSRRKSPEPPSTAIEPVLLSSPTPALESRLNAVATLGASTGATAVIVPVSVAPMRNFEA